jgi:hypothetical protein
LSAQQTPTAAKTLPNTAFNLVEKEDANKGVLDAVLHLGSQVESMQEAQATLKADFQDALDRVEETLGNTVNFIDNRARKGGARRDYHGKGKVSINSGKGAEVFNRVNRMSAEEMRTTDGQVICFHCLTVGHYKRSCPRKDEPAVRPTTTNKGKGFTVDKDDNRRDRNYRRGNDNKERERRFTSDRNKRPAERVDAQKSSNEKRVRPSEADEIRPNVTAKTDS